MTDTMHNDDWMQSLLLLDRTEDLSEPDPLYSFALDELLCKATGEGGAAVCHLWRHPRAFVMGLRDSRLPHAAAGRRWLEEQGYAVAVRNSGGAAVPLDTGVVNLSLILPKQQAEDMHFHGDFERMYQLIGRAVALLGGHADKGEVLGSYCPGEYDLSVAGLKFCGIAQRRQVHAYIVQAFILADGKGESRAEWVREFYRRAAGDAPVSAYPAVETGSMASLSELAGLGGNAAGLFTQAVKQVIREQQSAAALSAAAERLSMPSPTEVRAMAEKLHTRYASPISSS